MVCPLCGSRLIRGARGSFCMTCHYEQEDQEDDKSAYGEPC